MKITGLLISLIASGIICMSCILLKNEVPQEEKGSTFDFSVIDQYVKGKKIVAIGESSHGVGQFYELKSELVQYLHKYHQFEVLAIEAGFADVNLAWSNVSQFTSLQLRDNSVFGNFRCKEINGLYEYLKEQSATDNPLIYTGFDCQLSSSYFTNELEIIFGIVDNRLSDTLANAFAAYYKIYPSVFEEDSTNYTLHKERFISSIQHINGVINDKKQLIQNELDYTTWQFDILDISLSLLVRSVDIPFKDRFNEENIFKGIVFRDQLMFQNLKWLIEEKYPSRKVIIWGHNAHIQKGPLSNSSTKWMGQHLRDEYEEDYYSIGLFAYKGNAYQQWTKKAMPFENSDSTYLEYKMRNTDKAMNFLNLDDQRESSVFSWIFEEVQALEHENGGVISFIPFERFDALINLYNVDIPTYQHD